MYPKAAIVFAITMIMVSLSPARAEDPEDDMIPRLHAAAPWHAAVGHHAVRFSAPQWPSLN